MVIDLTDDLPLRIIFCKEGKEVVLSGTVVENGSETEIRKTVIKRNSDGTFKKSLNVRVALGLILGKCKRLFNVDHMIYSQFVNKENFKSEVLPEIVDELFGSRLSETEINWIWNNCLEF